MPMRFHTSHLMILVALAAVAFGVILHPQSLIGAAVPLVGWVLVVLPVLGTVELLHLGKEMRSKKGPTSTATVLLVGWSAILICMLAVALLLWQFG